MCDSNKRHASKEDIMTYQKGDLVEYINKGPYLRRYLDKGDLGIVVKKHHFNNIVYIRFLKEPTTVQHMNLIEIKKATT